MLIRFTIIVQSDTDFNESYKTKPWMQVTKGTPTTHPKNPRFYLFCLTYHENFMNIC